VAYRMSPILLTLRVTFAVRNLSNSRTCSSGNVACAKYGMFAVEESESARGCDS